MTKINDLSVGLRFELLASLCQYYKRSFSIEWDNGRYIPGEFIDPKHLDAEPLPEHIRQGPVGWEVEVGGWAHEGLLPTLDRALNAAIQTVIEKIGPIPPTEELSRPI